MFIGSLVDNVTLYTESSQPLVAFSSNGLSASGIEFLDIVLPPLLGAPNATLKLACRYLAAYPSVIQRAGHDNVSVTSPTEDACLQAEGGGIGPPTPAPTPEFSGTAPWFLWGTVGFACLLIALLLM